ncbi:MAG: group I intron-associated PD-(D/E)XK endonuclease [Solirubrobacteraceae bacterium]
MLDLTPSRKGAIAEIEISAAAIRFEIVVLRPVVEGGRYDLAFDLGRKLLRIQCKWASRCGNVINIRCATSRHTPRGYVKTTYSVDEIDAIAAYSPDLDCCYLIPIAQAAGMAAISLRVAPTRNNQSQGVRWARDYEFGASLSTNWSYQCGDIRRGQIGRAA